MPDGQFLWLHVSRCKRVKGGQVRLTYISDLEALGLHRLTPTRARHRPQL